MLYHKIVCCRSKSEGTRGRSCGVCPEKLTKKIEFFHIDLLAIAKKPRDPSVTRSDFWSFWHFCPPRVPWPEKLRKKIDFFT